ncbi:hypothetical protein FISHEDRAFT_49609, partial [Fistulina hepatica ATCC 64428]
ALLPKYINVMRGWLIFAIIGGCATAPCEIQGNAAALLAFLSAYCVFMSPTLAILVCDMRNPPTSAIVFF